MTQIRAASVLLSAEYAGLAMGYRILNTDDTLYSAFTTVNVVEAASDVVSYRVVGGITAPDEGGTIIWGTAGNDIMPGSIPPASPTAASIAAAVWAAGSRTLTSFGSLVGDVWANATRSLTDKAGFSLSSAGVQAIWDALTSALTTTGSIGKRIVDNLDATVSSRLATSGYTAPDNAGILAGLAALPGQVWAYATRTLTSGAGGATAAEVWGYGDRTLTAFGSNTLIEWTYTLTNLQSGQPLAYAQIRLSTDALGNNTVWVGTTDLFGIARDANGQKPRLPAGTYYVWRALSGFVFSDPDTETVG